MTEVLHIAVQRCFLSCKCFCCNSNPNICPPTPQPPQPIQARFSPPSPVGLAVRPNIWKCMQTVSLWVFWPSFLSTKTSGNVGMLWHWWLLRWSIKVLIYYIDTVLAILSDCWLLLLSSNLGWLMWHWNIKKWVADSICWSQEVNFSLNFLKTYFFGCWTCRQAPIEAAALFLHQTPLSGNGAQCTMHFAH